MNLTKVSKESWVDQTWYGVELGEERNERNGKFHIWFKKHDDNSWSGYGERSKYGTPCKSRGPTRGTCSQNGSSSRFCVYAPLNALREVLDLVIRKYVKWRSRSVGFGIRQSCIPSGLFLVVRMWRLSKVIGCDLLFPSCNITLLLG